MHRLPRFSLLAVGLAACGGGDRLPYTIDSRVDGVGTVALVAYGDGDRWAAADEVEPGVFTFTPSDETVSYATVCAPGPTSPGASFVQLAYTTYADAAADRRVEARCGSGPALARYRFAVTPAEATISVDQFQHAADGDVYASDGVHDVIAHTRSRILVRRGVRFPLTEELRLDIDTDGVDLVPLGVTVPAGADEDVHATYELETAGGTIAYFSAPGPGAVTLPTMPASVLATGDRHRVGVRAQRGLAVRSTTLHARSAPTRDPALELPAGLGGLDVTAGDSLDVAWTGRPAGDQVVQIEQLSHRVNWSASMSAAWLGATERSVDGAWSVPDLGAVPGWSPAWNLDLTAPSAPSVWVHGGTTVDDEGVSQHYDASAIAR